jgi:hypothetical protein
MQQAMVMELLKNYRCYEYAAQNCGELPPGRRPVVISELRYDPLAWDQHRYNKIVHMVKGAVEHCLSDDQQTIIRKRYLERNQMTLQEIADFMGLSVPTVSRMHKAAIQRLCIALDPLASDEMEITPFHHMWEGVIKSPA